MTGVLPSHQEAKHTHETVKISPQCVVNQEIQGNMLQKKVQDLSKRREGRRVPSGGDSEDTKVTKEESGLELEKQSLDGLGPWCWGSNLNSFSLLYLKSIRSTNIYCLLAPSMVLVLGQRSEFTKRKQHGALVV